MMTTPLDAIVVRLNPTQRNEEWKGKQVYSYDPKTGEATLYRPPLLGLPLLRKNLIYYRVAPQETVTCPPVEVAITDSANQKRLIEAVLVIQRIDQERVTDFVAVLARHDGKPFEIFTALVGEWIRDFVNQKRIAKIDAFTRFCHGMEGSTAARQECAQYCVAQSKKLFGMYLTCEIRLPEADLTIDPISSRFPVFTKDCEEELTVHIDLTILPPDREERRNLALQRLVPAERIHEAVKKRTGQWFRKECSLEAFCYEPANVREDLESELRSYIEGELCRDLFNLRVTCSVPFDKEFQIREDYDVTCEIEPSQTKIPVRHKVLLDRVDIAKLRRASIDNLEDWLEKTLTRHTRSVFFGKKYADVVTDFDRIQNEIKDHVSTAAVKIGFRVTHLVTIPTDEQMRSCLEGMLSFETDIMAFKTKDSRVEFKLSAAARIKLNSLEKVKIFLRPGDYLREQFKRVTREETARVVRQLEPESLYTKFRESLEENASPHGEENSPEAKIKEAIIDRLQAEFDAKTDDLTLTEESTELTELFSAIRPPKNQHINVSVETHGDYGEQLSFQFDYRIVSIAVGGWPQFQDIAHNCEATGVAGKAKEIIEAITKMLSNVAAGQLKDMPPNLLRSPSFKVKESIRGHAIMEALDKVKRHFGLEVEVLSSMRDVSYWEEKSRERTRQRYETLIDRLDKLDAEYSERMASLPPDDPLLKELEEKIKICQKDLEPFDTGHDQYFSGSEAAIPAPEWQQFLLGLKEPPEQVTDESPTVPHGNIPHSE